MCINYHDMVNRTAYDSLGSRSVNGAEGAEVVATLSEEYRVVFAVESVHEAQGVVKFKQLSLQQLRRDPDGSTVFPQTMYVDWVRVYGSDS